MKGLPQETLDSLRLSRDAKVASELYFLLLNKSQELDVLKSGTIGNVRVLDSALDPYEPVSPKKAPVLALSLFLGLAAGIAAAFAKKALDQGVEDPAEIESATGVSVYASVPYSAKEVELARQRRTSTAAASVLAAVDPGDLAVESLRSLRTALQFALVDATTNVVTISGPSPGVGKSFVSANLAHVLATSGKRVLLIDGDLRRGGLHRYLGGKRSPGLSEVVSGQCSLAEATRKSGQENLEFIATGKLPPNPSEIVGSPRFRAFLTEVCGKYDLVLIDTPPILAVTDGAIIGRHAGVNLLILRAGQHPIREIALAVKRFADAGVSIHGSVFNAVNMAAGRFSRAYQYHYQYAYRSESTDD
jgi:tyrosine-protein kinase Etk/Wzc